MIRVEHHRSEGFFSEHEFEHRKTFTNERETELAGLREDAVWII
ncbi:hypothetical protein [Caballeronia arationis]|jgi:hypothetical protein|nr:hypothetical protein [Caballeronia arationis]